MHEVYSSSRGLHTMPEKSAPALFETLEKNLKSEGPELVKRVKGLVVFDIDGEHWSLDLREGEGALSKGKHADKPDLTLTMTDTNFVQLVMGKLNPQQAFLLRKLKIAGSMAMALKLQPILDAAAPKAKL